MSSYFIYYTEASVVCVVIFAIMLLQDVFSVDRQEKQIKYDHALIAFMLYFVSDAVWAAVIDGVLPVNRFTVLGTNFANYVLMGGISFTWLRYVMAVEQIEGRDSRRTRLAVQLPFVGVTVALIAAYLIRPELLLEGEMTPTLAYSAFQIALPCVYIAATLAYTVRRALDEENPIERKSHLFVGVFPLMVVAGGLLQILVLPDTPVFCFCCAILMLVFYIRGLETRISTDPLTGLNNRGQLVHYTAQSGNLRREGRQTFVVMFDINDFKAINDTFGHAEGDRALTIVAEALRGVLRANSMPMFAARYGGDEFILIAHPVGAEEIAALVTDLRGRIDDMCLSRRTPYAIAIGAGIDRLAEGEDTFQRCMQRADRKLYLDKAAMKRRPA